MIVAWAVALVVGVVATSVASRRAVGSALRATDGLGVSPALVGMTVMAIGTDLPEIANSLVSSAGGHGDVNVGDSMGSAFTQVTLTLGLLCLGGRIISADRRVVLAVGGATVVAVASVRLLVDDGELSRLDGAILVALWIGGTALYSQRELRSREAQDRGRAPRVGPELLRTIGWLAAVGASAVIIIESFLRLAASLGVPEFVGSFVVLSIGTSLPELFVDWTAIRRGASSLAIGDIFGSSFVDSTLSVGIGPAVFSVAVSSDVFTGTVLAAAGIAVATAVMSRSPTHGRRTGAALLALYVIVQAATVIVVS